MAKKDRLTLARQRGNAWALGVHAGEEWAREHPNATPAEIGEAVATLACDHIPDAVRAGIERTLRTAK